MVASVVLTSYIIKATYAWFIDSPRFSMNKLRKLIIGG